MNTTQVEELADLRVALEACEEKWYNEGFANAENSTKLVVNQARRLGFEAEWFVTLQVLGVLEDSPLRDPGQIPFPSSTPAAQNSPVPIDEEETASMRELVEQIDAHAELDETEATSIPHARWGSAFSCGRPAAKRSSRPDWTHRSVNLIAEPTPYCFSLFLLSSKVISFPVSLPMSPGCVD